MRTFIPSKKVTYKITDNGVYFNTGCDIPHKGLAASADITLTTFKSIPAELTKHKNVKFMLRTLEMTSVFEYASVIFHVSGHSVQLPDKYLLMVKINGYEEVIESDDLNFLLELAAKQDRVAAIIKPIGSRDHHEFDFTQIDQWRMETTERCFLRRTFSVYAYNLSIGDEEKQGNVRNLAEYLFKRYTHGPIG